MLFLKIKKIQKQNMKSTLYQNYSSTKTNDA
jgi:hypothetical protein